MINKNNTHIINLKPTFDDLDLGGIVYNPNHMIYCDRARNEFFASRGEEVLAMFYRDIVFAVAACNAQYKLPLFLETYKMATRLVRTSDKVLFFEHGIFSSSTDDSEIATVESLESIIGIRFFAQHTLVCVSIARKASQSIPKELMEKFR
jgi:YbgC/YbaW family acyl-CoA thioester hydrolase